MKTILLFLFVIALQYNAFSQKPDKALARVQYTFYHMQDTLQRDKFYTENMLLVIGKNASVYTSYDKINNALDVYKQIEEQTKINPGRKLDIKRSTKQTSGTDYYIFFNENKLFTQERLINYYLINEEIPSINWTLSKDTMSFSGIKCKKATANFKGRNWIAWYALELPFQSGPWKLNSLPGLIIEAYDDKKEVQFKFSSFENIKDEITENQLKKSKNSLFPSVTDLYLDTEIKLSSKSIRTNQKDFKNLKEAYEKDPEGFASAQAITNGMMSIKMVAPEKPKENSLINNPIELPGKNK